MVWYDQADSPVGPWWEIRGDKNVPALKGGQLGWGPLGGSAPSDSPGRVPALRPRRAHAGRRYAEYLPPAEAETNPTIAAAPHVRASDPAV